MKTPPRPRKNVSGPPSPRRPQSGGTSSPVSPDGVRRSGDGGDSSRSVGSSRDDEYTPTQRRYAATRQPLSVDEQQRLAGLSGVDSRTLSDFGVSVERDGIERSQSPRVVIPLGRSADAQSLTPHEVMRTLRTPTGQRDAVDVLGSNTLSEDAFGVVERLDEHLRARRRGWLHYALMNVVVVVVVAVVVWVVFFSSLFALDASRITVSGGDERFTNEAAQQVIAAHAGMPITRMSMGSLEDELRSVTQVRDAEVSRVWPAGLTVVLSMRVPVMVEKSSDGFVLLDEDAVSLAVQESAPAGLPIVDLPDDEAQRVEAAAALAAVRAAVPDSVRSQIAGWVIESHQVQFTLVDGRVVKWGTTDDTALKARVISLLLEQREASVYDVSSPTSPVTS